MIKNYIKTDELGFEWIDICGPTPEELSEIAHKYDLQEASVQDCLQSDHLPKFEHLDTYRFIIFRVCNLNEVMEADTIQELTNKVAFFVSDSYLITIHRTTQPFIDDLAKRCSENKYQSLPQLLNELIRNCLATYEHTSIRLAKEVDYYEENVFLRSRKVPLLKGLYYLHRKIALIKRVLILSHDIVEHLDTSKHRGINTRDTRDLYVKMQNVYDSLYDNINQLLNAYFSTASQRTNDTMRVLTIFSVFFMPLTFIVGVYGMNFKYMPELDWKYGYPCVMLAMALITFGCYKWFRKKGWL